MTAAASTAGRSRPATVARAFLVVALLLSTWGFHYRLDDCPAYLDYDSSTLGIFVNNVSFHDDYAYGLRNSTVDQDLYRAAWAAEFLPASVVLSRLQRWLGVSPDGVGDLLEFAALFFGAVGLACVVQVACRRRRSNWEEGLFVAGWTAVLPCFLLYLRTTEPHFPYAFAMFWAAVACMDRSSMATPVRRCTFLGSWWGSMRCCPTFRWPCCR